VTLHDCRLMFASLMIAAGVNAKALSTYMGHANIAITMDRYGRLMPGNEDQAARLLDAYVMRARSAGSAQDCASIGDRALLGRPVVVRRLTA
jgi:integrase